MPILYSVISRGSTVLAKYAECVGNFAEVTEQIISKIAMENHKLTYSHGEYLIHYICENRIIYMCITDNVSTIYLLYKKTHKKYIKHVNKYEKNKKNNNNKSLILFVGI